MNMRAYSALSTVTRGGLSDFTNPRGRVAWSPGVIQTRMMMVVSCETARPASGKHCGCINCCCLTIRRPCLHRHLLARKAADQLQPTVPAVPSHESHWAFPKSRFVCPRVTRLTPHLRPSPSVTQITLHLRRSPTEHEQLVTYSCVPQSTPVAITRLLFRVNLCH